MVAKSRPKPTDEEAEEIMNEKTNHSDHVRTKNYDEDCYWCKMFGYIQDTPEKPSESG